MMGVVCGVWCVYVEWELSGRGVGEKRIGTQWKEDEEGGGERGFHILRSMLFSLVDSIQCEVL